MDVEDIGQQLEATQLELKLNTSSETEVSSLVSKEGTCLILASITSSGAP